MRNEIVKNFVHAGDVEEQLVERYKDKVPQEVIELWKDYGFGSFYNGYFKIINPDDYRQLLDESYWLADVSIPIFVTAFGDVITWEKNNDIGIVFYRYGDFDVITSHFKYFYNTISDIDVREQFFALKKYEKAVEMYGPLAYDECFGYFPILALGGKEATENLKKVKIREYIALITALAGEI